ncbi:hypothetical protein V6N11_071739 [Hibiscus sabdariffa]|uniref:Uncharacterized protein n=1 Tax=Hibiscus sabdariffa TaxID=183260 RepID=A0ABR2U169_9ROSI
MLVTRSIFPWHICGSSKIVMDDKGDASAETTGPARAGILAGILSKICQSNRTPVCISRPTLPRQLTNLLPWRDNLLPWRKIFGLGRKSSALAGKSTLAGNMSDSAQITNSAPTDAIVAALAGSECHQPGTASVQLRKWL